MSKNSDKKHTRAYKCLVCTIKFASKYLFTCDLHKKDENGRRKMSSFLRFESHDFVIVANDTKYYLTKF